MTARSRETRVGDDRFQVIPLVAISDQATHLIKASIGPLMVQSLPKT